MDIEWIKERVEKNELIFTFHAEQERQNDNLSVADIKLALGKGKIIEQYPEDKRGESCLVLGYSANNGPIHSVCGKNTDGWLLLITVYVPTKPKWKTPEKRAEK